MTEQEIEYLEPDHDDLWAGHSKDQSGNEHTSIKSLEELGYDTVEEAYANMPPIRIHKVLWYWEYNDGQHRINFCRKHNLKVPVIRE